MPDLKTWRRWPESPATLESYFTTL